MQNLTQATGEPPALWWGFVVTLSDGRLTCLSTVARYFSDAEAQIAARSEEPEWPVHGARIIRIEGPTRQEYERGLREQKPFLIP